MTFGNNFANNQSQKMGLIKETVLECFTVTYSALVKLKELVNITEKTAASFEL